MTAASNSPYRVLVVDDNRDAAETLAMLLELLGHDVRVAHDGVQALECGAQFKPHAVLLDLGLPLLNGLDVCTRMRSEPWGKHALMVAVTGWGQASDRTRSREAGFDTHLVKPVEPQALEETLSRLTTRFSSI
jgi:CheY-like chemotaxis protein